MPERGAGTWITPHFPAVITNGVMPSMPVGAHRTLTQKIAFDRHQGEPIDIRYVDGWSDLEATANAELTARLDMVAATAGSLSDG